MIQKLISLITAVMMVLSNGAVGMGSQKSCHFSGREKIMQVENNFTAGALDYLETIAEKYSDRGDISPLSQKRACREWIIKELLDAGYDETQIREQTVFAKGLPTGKNVVLSVEGVRKKQVIVGAHYDGDGIGDNGSGLALLLATAVGFAGRRMLYTVKYVFFDNEEIGLFGAETYVNQMTDEEKENTLFMINMDSLAFGDYCNIYGGVTDFETGKVTQTASVNMAMKRASALGYHVWNTKKLDGYYEKHGEGPALDPIGLFTNPWTAENPAPANNVAYSPAQCMGVSDHDAFVNAGIEYIYFEATNWYAMGKRLNGNSYTGYFETTDTSVGEGGMFMNTRHDTFETLETLYPGRIVEHFNLYSRLLSSLILWPVSK